MPPIKREAVYASIRSQLMAEPQRGTMLLLNILKLFADRKDDGEFVKEMAELASDLALASASMDIGYGQSPLFAQPMSPMMPYPSIQVPSIADFNSTHIPDSSQKEKQQPIKKKEIADDAVSALNQMGEDTTQFYHKNSNEPVIEGYEEWTPKPKKGGNKKAGNSANNK